MPMRREAPVDETQLEEYDMSGYFPNGYWYCGAWYQYYPQGVFQPAIYPWITVQQYTNPQTAFIVGPCNMCNRNFALVNPAPGQPVPKLCGECAANPSPK